MIRKLSIGLFFIFSLSSPLFAGEFLTVEKALELAYENNPVLMASLSKEEQARQQIAQAKASKLPQLGVSLAAQFSKDDTLYPVIGGGGGAAFAGWQNAYQAALTLNWLLYSSGTVPNAIKAKEFALLGVEAQSVRTGQAVENGVRKAYYSLQRARAKLTVAQEFLDLAKEHLAQVESFYRYGVVAKNQVLRVQVDVSEGKLNVIKAENAVDVGWSALERAVGTSLKDTYDMVDSDTEVSDRSVPEDSLALAIAQRPELVALEHSRSSALAMAKAAAGTRGPQIGFQAQVSEADNSFFPSGNDDWKISLSATWTFFDGGESAAKEKEAEAAAQELIHSIEDLKKQIAMEISSGKLNLESAVQRIEVARDQVASAEEDYRMALKRYTANVGTNIDVLDARVSFTNAKTQLVDGIYDTYIARSDLDYALGLSGRFILKSDR